MKYYYKIIHGFSPEDCIEINEDEKIPNKPTNEINDEYTP